MSLRHFVACLLLAQPLAWAKKGRATVAVVAKSVKGKLPPAELEAFFVQHGDKLAACAARAAGANPELSGVVDLEMTLSRDGTVTSAAVNDTTLADNDIESCLTNTLVGLKWAGHLDAQVTSKCQLSIKAAR